MGYKPEDETKNAFVDGPETRGVVREEVEEEKEEIERVAKLREHVLSTKKGWIEWGGEEQGEERREQEHDREQTAMCG